MYSIFSSYIHEEFFNFNTKEFKEEILKIKFKDKGRKVSNYGGWQSNYFVSVEKPFENLFNKINFIVEDIKNKLNINKMHKEVSVLYEDHKKFANEMDSILLMKKGKLDNAINTLEDKLEQWKKVRKWENKISRSLLKEPDELDRLLKKLCHEETTRDFYKGPRGKSLQMLDMSKEYCKNLLNAGQSLATVWKTIDLEMSKEKINTSTIPKPEFLAITK